MLILSRRTGEKIIIGKDIVITVLKSKGSQTRIGISAPPKISVHREEVYQLIQMQTYSAQAAPEEQAFAERNEENKKDEMCH